MSYVAQRQFPAQPGMEVVVYEYWTVAGALVRECVPVADDYNRARYASYTRFRLVGVGSLVERIGYAYYHDTWHVSWVRAFSTPPFPFGWRWRVTRRLRSWRALAGVLVYTAWVCLRTRSRPRLMRLTIDVDETYKFAKESAHVCK